MNARYPFIDLVSGRDCALVIDTDFDWYDGGVGAEHPTCDQLADVSPDLDAFYCSTCGWNGRVSGAWVVDMVKEAS